MSKPIKNCPDCIYGNRCTMICINSNCRKPAFICQQGLSTKSECALFHEKCQKMQWSQLDNIICQNPNTKIPQLFVLQEQMENVFSTLIKKVKQEHLNFKKWISLFGFNPETMNFINMINEQNYNNISSVYMNQILSALFMNEDKVLQTNFSVEECQKTLKNLEQSIDKIKECISFEFLQNRVFQVFCPETHNDDWPVLLHRWQFRCDLVEGDQSRIENPVPYSFLVQCFIPIRKLCHLSKVNSRCIFPSVIFEGSCSLDICLDPCSNPCRDHRNHLHSGNRRQLHKIKQLYMTEGKKEKMSMSTTVSSLGNDIHGFDSRVTNQQDYIRSLFPKQNIKSFNLLYRASENAFSVAEFHKKCDNIGDTITILETEYGKVIGGYTPLAWNSSKKHWAADKSMTSFIFSVDLRQKFNLNLAQFAIACNPDKGPIFGCCDICIVDKSNVEKSNAEFPISYNNFKYTRNPESSQAFTGHVKGRFTIKDWEVFKVEFSE